MAINKPITLAGWNEGGLADSKLSGTKNSLYQMVGVDPHSEPAFLKAEQKLTKDSGSTITEFVKCIVPSSNGRVYHFSADSGKIWEESSGSYTLVHTTTPAAGEAKCLGATEFGGYIIWATQSRLHRILATNAEGAAEWAANASEDWQTFTNTDNKYHPMAIQNLNLYIGDGNYVAEWDGTTFTADALDLVDVLRITCLGKLPTTTDLLIGTYQTDNISKAEILRWNTWSVSFTTSDPIDEVGINAIIPADNFVFISAGKQGNIYMYDGTQMELYRKVIGSWSPSNTAIVHPNAACSFNGQALFGMSNVANNPCLMGVYRIGRHSRNYPYILDMPYPISERSGGALVTSGIEIGAIAVVGQEIAVSWKNSTTYGVDRLDPSNKLSGAYFVSRVMRPDRMKRSMFSRFDMAYSSLPASTALALTYDSNYTGSYTTPTSSQVTDTDRKIIYLEEGIESSALMLKCAFTCNSDDTPSLEQIDIHYQ